MCQVCDECSEQHRAEAFILAILVLNTNQLTCMLKSGVCVFMGVAKVTIQRRFHLYHSGGHNVGQHLTYTLF